ncbi:MAG: hypothetical protein ABR589_00065 [Chthoniobacterales bacterium]
MKPLLSLILAVALTAAAAAGAAPYRMCVKQKDGTYKCKASGKIEKEPCCATWTNAPSTPPKGKK